MTPPPVGPDAPGTDAPDHSAAPDAPASGRPHGRPRLPRPHPLTGLPRGEHPLGYLGPNWFASVMGTAIVPVAAATLPVEIPGVRTLAVVFWVIAVVQLVAVTVATVVHWRVAPRTARGHLEDPIMGHFYGAPAMALMAVGAGALLVGIDLIGAAGLVVAVVLWVVGTVLGLVAAVLVPYRVFTGDGDVGPAFGGWLMPVVPPMVSAATGALLIPYLPEGQYRLTALMAGYALVGMALIAGLTVITLIWSQLAREGAGPPGTVPTLFIVLGPMGQSITAVGNLGDQAPISIGAPYDGALSVFGVVYGVPIWGFALLWAGIAGGIVWRTARTGMPFTLSWWSFVFPVGTVVTGTSGLARATGSVTFDVAAVALFVVLLATCLVVGTRTVHGVWSGSLLRSS